MKRTLAMLVVLWSSVLWGANPPEQAAPAALPGQVSILLLPLSSVGDTKMGWAGQAVQQNLLTELSRINAIQPLVPKPNTQLVDDVDGAVKAAVAVGASYVMFGSVQEGAAGLRITGQVLDVRSGKYVGGVKATGTARDLFAMEDSIGEQMKRILLAQVPVQTKAAPATQPAIPPIIVQIIGQPGQAPVVQGGQQPGQNFVPAFNPVKAAYPWDEDAALIDYTRRVLDADEYAASVYRNRYMYGGYNYYGYSGYYYRPSYAGPGYYGGHTFSGAYYFPRGVGWLGN